MIGAGGGGAVALIIILPLAFFLFIYLIYFVFMVVFDDKFRTKILTEPTVSAVVFVLGVGAFTWFFYAEYQNQKFWAEVTEKLRIEREARNITLTEPLIIKGERFPAGTYIENYNKTFSSSKEYDFDFATFPTSYDYHGYSISYIEDLWSGRKNATVKFAKPTQLMEFTCQADSKVELNLEERPIEFADCILAEPITFRGVTWERGSKVDVSSDVYWDNRERDIANKNIFYTYIVYRIHGVGTVTKNGMSYHEKLSYILRGNYSFFAKEEIRNANDVIVYGTSFEPYKSIKASDGNYYCQLQSNYINSRYKLTHIKTGKIYTGVTDDKGLTAKMRTDGEQSFHFDIYSD